MRARVVVWVGLALAAAACTGGADDADPSGQGDELDVTATFDPSPARAGRNTLVVDVADAAGDPVDDALVTVDPQMPAHGHGSTEDPVIEAQTGGRYIAYPVTFPMAGSWVVTVTATAGAQSGVLELEVEIP